MSNTLERLAGGIVVYSIAAGGVAVGAVYLAAHSGPLMLASAGIGVLLLVIGVGAPRPTGAAVTDAEMDGSGELPENPGEEAAAVDAIRRSTPVSDVSIRVRIALFGLGVFVWSLLVLFFLRSSLQ